MLKIKFFQNFLQKLRFSVRLCIFLGINAANMFFLSTVRNNGKPATCQVYHCAHCQSDASLIWPLDGVVANRKDGTFNGHIFYYALMAITQV